MATLPKTARGIIPAARTIPTAIDQKRKAISSGSLIAVRKRTMESAPTMPRESTTLLAAGMIPLAVFGSVIIGVILTLFCNKRSDTTPYIVVVQCTDKASETGAKDLVQKAVDKFSVKSKTVRKGFIELTMEVRVKNDDTEFINDLADLNGVSSAVLVSYNGDYMG